MPKAHIPQHLTEAQVSDIVEMALSDHVSFAQINDHYGLADSEVKALMSRTLRRGSYVAWRKRVQSFSARRAHYK